MSVPSLLPDVQAHFRSLAESPTSSIDAVLLDRFELQLTENVETSLVHSLVLQIAQLILSVHQDASPLAKLGTKIVVVSKLTFSSFATLDSNLDLNAGLNIPSKEINFLVVTIIEKAAESASETALIAGKPELVASLVNLWLRTDDTRISSKILEVLLSLLDTDLEEEHGSRATDAASNAASKGRGSGLMWRRLFGDKAVYESFFSLCTLSNAGEPGQLRIREKSIAQGRLMDFIKGASELDWTTVSSSHFQHVETRYGVRDGGLLEFAACQMVDSSDPLAYLTLISFFTDLLAVSVQDPPRSTAATSATLNHSSPALEFFIAKQLHTRIISYYLEPASHDPVDLRFLSGPSAKYLVTYISRYPKHFLERSGPLVPAVIARIRRAFEISPNTWGQQEYPRNSLNILAVLPRVLLIHDNSTSNPMLMLPTRPWNADIFHTLGTLFHGPDQSSPSYTDPLASSNPYSSEPEPTSADGEAAAARVLYLLYSTHHPDFWSDIVAAAESVALSQTALAAISVISSVITADWVSLPSVLPSTGGHPPPRSSSAPSSSSSRQYHLPLETQFQRLDLLPVDRKAPGVWAILQPPALSLVLTYLFQQPKVFDKGSGRFDDASSTYQVAMAKYDVLVRFHERLKELQLGEFERVEEAVARRVQRGPWPRDHTNRPGERVEAMEM